MTEQSSKMKRIEIYAILQFRALAIARQLTCFCASIEMLYWQWRVFLWAELVHHQRACLLYQGGYNKQKGGWCLRKIKRKERLYWSSHLSIAIASGQRIEIRSEWKIQMGKEVMWELRQRLIHARAKDRERERKRRHVLEAELKASTLTRRLISSFGDTPRAHVTIAFARNARQ